MSAKPDKIIANTANWPWIIYLDGRSLTLTASGAK